MEKTLNKTSKFGKGTWVTGNLNFINTFFVGRIDLLNGEEWVAITTNNGEQRFLPITLVHNLKRLMLFTMPPRMTSPFLN